MSSHRILIVEDQREVSRLLRSALETLEAELEVVEIPSGEEAILYSSRTTKWTCWFQIIVFPG